MRGRSVAPRQTSVQNKAVSAGDIEPGPGLRVNEPPTTPSFRDAEETVTRSYGPEGSGSELQVKSVERVRDLGEVFTPAATVQAMLDTIPDEMWLPHPAATFFEPACGDGNFLVAVLDRKLDGIVQARVDGTLTAGATQAAVQFHALEALASIYAVDISTDNVIGGRPGHRVRRPGYKLANAGAVV